MITLADRVTSYLSPPNDVLITAISLDATLPGIVQLIASTASQSSTAVLEQKFSDITIENINSILSSTLPAGFAGLISATAVSSPPDVTIRDPALSSSPPCTYTLMSGSLSWAAADAACQAAGLLLASVQSAAQNAPLVTAAAGNQVWIGGTDAASEGAWVWSPFNTPLSYTNWNGVEPNNAHGGEDCLLFNWGSPGKWNDDKCMNQQKYVCQQPH